MKKIILSLLIIFSLIVFGCSKSPGVVVDKDKMMEKETHVNNSTTEGNNEDREKDIAIMDEVFEMSNGKMMIVNAKTKSQSQMIKDESLEVGIKVMTDGTIIYKNGTRTKLTEGMSIWMDGTVMKASEMTNEKMIGEKGMMETEYKGKVLAGTTTKYLDFNKEDYDKALKENKKILLNSYAN